MCVRYVRASNARGVFYRATGVRATEEDNNSVVVVVVVVVIIIVIVILASPRARARASATTVRRRAHTYAHTHARAHTQPDVASREDVARGPSLTTLLPARGDTSRMPCLAKAASSTVSTYLPTYSMCRR